MSAATPTKLAKSERIAMLLTSFGLIGLLSLAALLAPDERGYGTHQQFGLSPCWFIEHWNMRCPSCGMTTSWAHLVRGEVGKSLRANSGGTAMALLAFYLSWSLLASAMRGHWVGRLPGNKSHLVLMTILGLTIGLDWIIRLL